MKRFSKKTEVAKVDAPADAKPAKKRRFRPLDITIFAVLAIIIIFLLVTLTSQLALKHEVAGARAVTNKAVADMQLQKSSDLHALGSTNFQKQYPTTLLDRLLTAFADKLKGTPIIVKQTVLNDKDSKTVQIIYKFTNNKQSYYVRVGAGLPKGQSDWKVIDLSGDATEALLE